MQRSINFQIVLSKYYFLLKQIRVFQRKCWLQIWGRKHWLFQGNLSLGYFCVEYNGTISEETQNTNLKEHKHPCVHCSIIYNHQDMEAAQVSISRWVDKITMGHLHNGILLGHKKEKSPFVTAMLDLENIMLSEISQSEKNKYHMISLTCGL